MSSQFGNPYWGHDDLPASDDLKEGRRQGIKECLRLILGPAILSNNKEFDSGVNAVVEMLRDRLAEL